MDTSKAYWYPGGRSEFRLSVFCPLLRMLSKWSDGKPKFPEDIYLLECEMRTRWVDLLVKEPAGFRKLLEELVEEVLSELKTKIRVHSDRKLHTQLVNQLVGLLTTIWKQQTISLADTDEKSIGRLMEFFLYDGRSQASHFPLRMRADDDDDDDDFEDEDEYEDLDEEEDEDEDETDSPPPKKSRITTSPSPQIREEEELMGNSATLQKVWPAIRKELEPVLMRIKARVQVGPLDCGVAFAEIAEATNTALMGIRDGGTFRAENVLHDLLNSKLTLLWISHVGGSMDDELSEYLGKAVSRQLEHYPRLMAGDDEEMPTRLFMNTDVLRLAEVEDVFSLRGEFMAACRLHLTGNSCDIQAVLDAVGREEDYSNVYSGCAVRPSVWKLVCGWMRETPMQEARVFEANAVCDVVTEALATSDVEPPEDPLKGFQIRQAELAKKTATPAVQVHMLLEQCLLGFTALARKLCRPFTEQETLLAVRQMVACLRVLLAKRDVAFFPWDERTEALADWKTLADVSGAPAGAAGAGSWRAAWLEVAKLAVTKPVNLVQSEDERMQELSDQLRKAEGFWTHADWRCEKQQGRQGGAGAAVDLAVVEAAGSDWATRESQSVARNAGLLLQKETEPGFAFFEASDGPYAETLRSPAFLRLAWATFMPSMSVLSSQETQAKANERDSWDMAIEKEQTGVIRTHFLHWKLLQSTKVFAGAGLPVTLLWLLCVDLARVLQTANTPYRVGPMLLPVEYDVDVRSNLGVVEAVAKEVFGSQLTESLSKPIAEMMTALMGTVDANLLEIPQAVVATMEILGSHSESIFFDPASRTSTGGSAQHKQSSPTTSRSEDKELGLMVSEVRGGSLKKELEAVIEKHARSMGRLQEELDAEEDEDSPRVAVEERWVRRLAQDLNYLYTKYEINDEGGRLGPGLWERYAGELAEKLFLNKYLDEKKKELLLKTGEEDLIEYGRLLIVSPRCYSRAVRALEERYQEHIDTGDITCAELHLENAVEGLYRTPEWILMQTGAGMQFAAIWHGVDIANNLEISQIWQDLTDNHLHAGSKDDLHSYWMMRFDKFFTHGYSQVGEYPMIPWRLSPALDHLAAAAHGTAAPATASASASASGPVKTAPGVAETPQVVAKDGFKDFSDKIATVTGDLGAILVDWVGSLDAAETGAEGKPEFGAVMAVVARLKTRLTESEMAVSDHSGFVAFLKRVLQPALVQQQSAAADKLALQQPVTEKLVQSLSLLFGSVALEKEKSRNKAVNSAKAELKTWFDIPAEDAVGDQQPGGNCAPTVTAAASPAAAAAAAAAAGTAPAAGKTAGNEKTQQASVAVDEESGLTMAGSDGAETVKSCVKKLVAEKFESLASSVKTKGAVSVAALDELRSAMQVETSDAGLKVADTEKWRKFVGEAVVGPSLGGLARGSTEWATPLVTTILASETGKDSKTATARRLLSEDKRSPFCKQAAEKLNDGTFKFKFDLEEDAEWSGLMLRESRIAVFQSRVAETVQKLDEALAELKFEFPKPLALVQEFSEEVELARFDVEAVVVNADELKMCLETALSERGFNAWHAEQLARLAVCQYREDESSKEKAAVEELLLNDRQSDFAADPYDGWRPVVTDGRLNVPQLPRTNYEHVGFSMQSEASEDTVLGIFAKTVETHLVRWRRRVLPLAFSVVDSLVRDLRGESFKHLLFVEEAAMMAIAFEETCLPGALFPKLTRLLSILAEYVVESLRLRPVPKTVQALRGKLLAIPGVFTEKETTAPRPVTMELGFAIPTGGYADQLEMEEAVLDAMEAIVSDLCKTRTLTPSAMTEKFKKLVTDLKMDITDAVCFQRFVYPHITLAIKSRIPTDPQQITLNVDELVEHALAGMADARRPKTRQTATHATAAGVKGAGIFDGSQPETYLEWRAQFLERMPLNEIGSRTSVDNLLAGAPLKDMEILAENFEGTHAKRFVCMLGYLNTLFDTALAKDFVLAELGKEIDKKRVERLLAIKTAFVDEPRGDRQKIEIFVNGLSAEADRTCAKAVMSFGDTRFAIFKARFAAFSRCAE